MLLQHVRCQRFLRINCRPTAAAAATVAAAATIAIRYCRCGFGVGVAASAVVVVAAAARLLAAVCQQHVASVASLLTKLLPHTSHGSALKSYLRVYTRRLL